MNNPLLGFGPDGWGDEIASGVLITASLALATLPLGLFIGFIGVAMVVWPKFSAGSGVDPELGTGIDLALPPSALRSYTVTLYPRSTSSCAAVNPATPAPNTATFLPGAARARGGMDMRAAAVAVPNTNVRRDNCRDWAPSDISKPPW